MVSVCRCCNKHLWVVLPIRRFRCNCTIKYEPLLICTCTHSHCMASTWDSISGSYFYWEVLLLLLLVLPEERFLFCRLFGTSTLYSGCAEVGLRLRMKCCIITASVRRFHRICTRQLWVESVTHADRGFELQLLQEWRERQGILDAKLHKTRVPLVRKMRWWQWQTLEQSVPITADIDVFPFD